jgi:O-antigen ligase
VLSVAVALLLGAVVYYAIPAVLHSDIQQPAWEFSEQMAGRPAPVASRVELMQEGMKMFWKSPIWGRGLGYFQYGRGSIAIIHNTFVWILVEMGMLGAGVFIWFLFGHLRRALSAIRRGPEQAKALAVGLLCSFAALTGFSLGIEALNQRHWWLIMALISSVWYLSRTAAPDDGD